MFPHQIQEFRIKVGRFQSPMFDAVVCDFSFALINALVRAWSDGLTLTRYLEVAYAIVYDCSPESISVPIVICCAHCLHLVAISLGKSVPSKVTRKFLKAVVGLMACSNNVNVAEGFFVGLPSY
jgi:hypothetical protein